MVQSSSSSSVTLLNKMTDENRVSNGITHRLTNGAVPNGNLKNDSSSSSSSSSGSGSSSGGNSSPRLQWYQRVIFGSLFLGYAIYTYNRKSVSYITPTLLTAGLVTTNTIGVISSCQNMAYAVSKFLGGVLSDKISARKLFSFGLVLSGTSTVLFSTTENPLLWSVLWAVNGFAQGCGWPSCAKLLKKWFSPANIGTWWSVLTASSNVSGTLSPLLAAFIIINHGWSLSLMIAGFLSVGMGVVTFLTLVDDPCSVDLVSPAQPPSPPSSSSSSAHHCKKNTQQQQQQQQQHEEDKKNEGVNGLLRSPFLWVISVCYICVFLAKTAISEWGQLYVMNHLGRSQMEASSFTSAMETGGMCGGILAGVLTDKVASKVQVRGNVRLLVAAAFMTLCTASLYVLTSLLTHASSQVAVSCVGAMLGGSMFGPISIYGIVASESFPSHLSGTAHAIVALAANVGAVLAGWPLSRVARTWSWPGVMVLLQVLSAGSAVLIVSTTGLHKQRKAKSE